MREPVLDLAGTDRKMADRKIGCRRKSSSMRPIFLSGNFSVRESRRGAIRERCSARSYLLPLAEVASRVSPLPPETCYNAVTLMADFPALWHRLSGPHLS